MWIIWRRRVGCGDAPARGGCLLEFVDLLVTVVVVGGRWCDDWGRSIAIVIDSIAVAHGQRCCVLVRRFAEPQTILVLILLLALRVRLLLVRRRRVSRWCWRWRWCGCNISIFLWFWDLFGVCLFVCIESDGERRKWETIGIYYWLSLHRRRFEKPFCYLRWTESSERGRRQI